MERTKGVNPDMNQDEQNQLLVMPWMALSDQIKMTNQRIDDLRSDVVTLKTDVLKRLDSMDGKLDKRVDRSLVVVTTVAGILVTFFVTYLTAIH